MIYRIFYKFEMKDSIEFYHARGVMMNEGQHPLGQFDVLSTNMRLF